MIFKLSLQEVKNCGTCPYETRIHYQVGFGSYTDYVFLGKSRQFLGLNDNDVNLGCGEIFNEHL